MAERVEHKASNYCYRCGRTKSEVLLESKEPYHKNKDDEVIYWCANKKECLQFQKKKE